MNNLLLSTSIATKHGSMFVNASKDEYNIYCNISAFQKKGDKDMLIYIPLIDHYSQYKIGRDDPDNLVKAMVKHFIRVFLIEEGIEKFFNKLYQIAKERSEAELEMELLKTYDIMKFNSEDFKNDLEPHEPKN